MNKTVLVVAMLVAGCASQPEKISSAYVSPLQYSNYDCQQLAMEATAVSRRANELRANLKKTADDDAAQMGVGLILFFPTLFFLEGGDGIEAQEYARLKGEHEAIESTSIQKKCGSGGIVEASGQKKVTDRLLELKKLKDKGLITEDEYERKRVTVLEDL